MKRTKHTSSRIVKLANDVIRPGFWLLSREKDPVNGLEKRTYRYGECRVIVTGRLFEEDRGTLICLLEIAKQNNYQPFDFDLSDITKEKGLKNPWQESALKPTRESIDRLFDAQIRIRPTKKKGLSAKFCLIEGWLESTDKGNLSVSPYLEIVRDLTLGTTNISLNVYFGIKSQIARSLYNFLSSQSLFYKGKGYEIRLSSLMKYLGYDVQDKPWWQVWDSVENAIKELKQIGFIRMYRYDKTRCKTDGGVLKFYAAKKKMKEPSTGDKNNEVIQLIKDSFLGKIEWTDSYENKLRTALNRTAEFLEQCQLRSLLNIISEYCERLKNKNLKYFTPMLFDPKNEFLRQFLKQQYYVALDGDPDYIIEYGEKWYKGEDGTYRNKDGRIFTE